MALFAGLVREQLTALLTTLRADVSARSLDFDRLPPWVRSARIRFGWINSSVVAVLEESPSGADQYRMRGAVDSDVVILLDTKNFEPSGASLEAGSNPGPLSLMGGYPDPHGSRMVLTTAQHAFFDCGHAGYHGPRILWDLFFELAPETATFGPVEVRFIPFGIYLHEQDLTSIPYLWERLGPHILEHFAVLHDSPVGDYYARLNTRTTALTRSAGPLALAKESGVIVLGSYSPPDLLTELTQVRDSLRVKGYDAQLIKDLPELAMMSNEEKVRLWTIASRYCVMVDRSASGHIAEFMILKEQRSILALLRRLGSGSTFMIGDAALVDANYIRILEFENSPIEVLNEAIDWAEGVARIRSEAYDKAYPWRGSS
jgi:hypothetical protein